MADMTDRDRILLAYGLLWHAPIDRATWVGLLASEAREELLVTITREDQSRGIGLAKKVMQGLQPE